MRLREIVFPFLWRFVLAYGVLIAPWPALSHAYARGFRAFGNVLFAKDDGTRLSRFEVVPAELKHALDTRILLANRTQLKEDGNVAAIYLELDSRAVGWIPTALFVALIFASPISWRRRLRALWSGLLIVHAFIAFSLAIYVWNHLPDVGLTTLSAFTKDVTDGVEETLLNQLGASFVVPVLIWILVTVPFPNLAFRNVVDATPARQTPAG